MLHTWHTPIVVKAAFEESVFILEVEQVGCVATYIMFEVTAQVSVASVARVHYKSVQIFRPKLYQYLIEDILS